jgi:hypothetical protein
MAYASTLPPHVRLALLMIRRELDSHAPSYTVAERIKQIIDALDEVTDLGTKPVDPAEPTAAVHDPDKPF